MDHWLRSGAILFGIEIPAGFERGVRRGDKPALLVAADASDPAILENSPPRSQVQM